MAYMAYVQCISQTTTDIIEYQFLMSQIRPHFGLDLAYGVCHKTTSRSQVSYVGVNSSGVCGGVGRGGGKWGDWGVGLGLGEVGGLGTNTTPVYNLRQFIHF